MENDKQVCIFVVDGTPVPKQRPRVYRNIAFTPVKTKNYQALVRDCFKLRCPSWKISDKKLKIRIEFYFKPPKSTSKKRLNGMIDKFCDNHKDLDNLEKSVLDSLNKVAYFDDKQIVEMHTTKKWAMNDFVKIQLEEIEE